MAKSGNGNTSGQSAASAQAAAAAGNAAASNAANGNGGSNSGASTNTSGNTSTSSGASSGATNSAGLMGSLIGFGNSITGNVGNTYGGGSGSSDSKSDDGKSNDALARSLRSDQIVHKIQNVFTNTEKARSNIPSHIVAELDSLWYIPNGIQNADAAAFEGKNTGPTYNPSIAARANTNPTIAKGSSEMGPSTPANAPAANTNNAPGGNMGGETGGIVSGAAPTNVSDATNAGVTNRGSTVANGGTSVTDSGTGGSISSSITPPSRDASSIGLGVYNTDRANYDQDNWNRGMESESSSLVSDEECKAFAKRAFMENSEPFKRVRISILKKC